ncbi:hypothetical protein P186_1055 [Pyrobaculum ferrireducens]|uniref:Uncharacterized protein n=1 Tax=Pyrobaculum ferrireducens TaxID=1104324 RepID=G7VBZ2_9CREN|nr:hypothetical protein P186_1055 [Pyrobaculum ferrireducens]
MNRQIKPMPSIVSRRAVVNDIFVESYIQPICSPEIDVDPTQ